MTEIELELGLNGGLQEKPIDDSNVTEEKLLEPSRITIKYENISKEEGLKTWMNAEVNVEPFEIKVGFRELEFFNKLNKNA